MNKLKLITEYFSRSEVRRCLFLTLLPALVFCSATTLFGIYMTWMLAAGGLCVLLCARRLRLSVFDLPLALFVLSVMAYDLVVSSELTLQPLVYLSSYIIGTNAFSLSPEALTERRSAASRRIPLILVSAMALGMALHLTLNILSSGSIDSMRISYDFWTGKAVAATIQSALCILGLGLSVALIFSDVKLYLRTAALLLCAVLSYLNIVLSGRSPLLITLIILILGYIFMLLECRRKWVRPIITGVLLIGALLSLTIYAANVGGIRTAVETSEFYKRFFSGDAGLSGFVDMLLSDGRLALKKKYLQNFSLSLWGGNKIFAVTNNYAHGIFLDSYDSWGLPALIPLLAYFILAAGRLLRTLFDRSVPFLTRQIILCCQSALFILFLLEPIPQGIPLTLAAFCLIDGLTAAHVRTRKQRRAPTEEELSPPTVVFFSSNLNHHQLPFCRAIIDRVGEARFTFVATEPLSEEQRLLGYADLDRAHSFVLREYEGEEEKIRAAELCLSADIMVFGSAPKEYFKSRAESGRLLYYYSERPDKETLYGKFTLRRRLAILRHLGLYAARSPKCYLLSAGHRAAHDFARCGSFIGRAYKWGYFPDTSASAEKEELYGKKQPGRLLWAGRFTEFKHPQNAIRTAACLRDRGVDFRLDMIGRGELEADCRRMIEELGLSDRVSLIGSRPAEEVRRQMEASPIFLFTSDGSEGWGAVVNEAMASGCAVVTNSEPGAVGYMIQSGKNGMITEDSPEAYAEAIAFLLENGEVCLRLGMAAADTVKYVWNAELAAERLLSLSRILRPEFSPRHPKVSETGICSKEKS